MSAHTMDHAKNYLEDNRTLWGWLSTTDHKKIGLMYLFTIMVYFLIGGILALLVRLELIAPGKNFFDPDTYNVLFTLHGAIMIFLFIVPGIPATLGNFLLPLMIGAKDVAFPRLNLASYYIFFIGSLIALISLLSPADTGWTFYAPYSMKSNSLVIWLTFGAFVMGFASIMTGFNFIVTIHRMRAPGLGWKNMPLFVWALYATAIIQLLATPVVGMNLVLLIFERVLDIGIFNPAKGGDPILFEQFFWFYSHPVVYIMILPAFGVASEILPVFSRRPIFGYKAIAYSSLAIALVSFLVWGHHLFVSGMSDWARYIFSFLTFFVAVPTAIKIFNWLATLWKGSLEISAAPMYYMLGFLFMFTIAGLTGLHLAVLSTDVYLHDTYFVVAHFHYTMQGGTVFALVAGLHYWFPKITGKWYNKKIAFWGWLMLFVGFNATFLPQFILGLEGMPRRYYDYLPYFQTWHLVSTIGSWMNGLGYLIVLSNLLLSAFYGKKAEGNPYNALSLEWQTTSPPPTENFISVPKFPENIYDYGTEGKIEEKSIPKKQIL
ncbi:MAG: cbb3-type cytochrome c oxidase subunit I [Leptonema sp. (in: bacteria)]